MALSEGVQYLGLPPEASSTTIQHSTSSKTLLKDPFIRAVVIAICISTSAMAILEPCLPIWLLETMQPEPWQLGTAFVPDSIGYFIGSSFFGVFALKVGRWKCALVAMIILGVSAICVSSDWSIFFYIIVKNSCRFTNTLIISSQENFFADTIGHSNLAFNCATLWLGNWHWLVLETDPKLWKMIILPKLFEFS